MKTVLIATAILTLFASQASAGILDLGEHEFSISYGVVRDWDFWSSNSSSSTALGISLGHHVAPRIVLSTELYWFKYDSQEDVGDFLGPLSLLGLEIGETEVYQLSTAGRFFWNEELTGPYVQANFSVYHHKALAWVDYEWGWDLGLGLGGGYRLQLMDRLSVYAEAVYNGVFVDTVFSDRMNARSGLAVHF